MRRLDLVRPCLPPLLALAVAAVVGCAAPDRGPDGTEADDSGRPTTALEAALAADNGLELRRVLFHDDGASIADLGRFGRDAVDDEYLRERLVRNGIRLRLLRESDADAALGVLGAPLRDARVWYGQAAQWRELGRRNVGPGLATIVDGRARSFSGGAIQLLARAWTLPMEDGLRLAVELVPHFDPVGAGGYRALLGHDSPRGERFDALMVELHLQPGDALILTADAPGRRWSVAEEVTDRADEPVDDERPRRADARAEPTHEQGPETEPGPGLGPDAAAPLTLGELLLRGEKPPVRSVLVFHPRLPGALAPRGQVVDGGGRR